MIIQHAEEPDLSEEGVVNEGEFSTRLGLVGIPSYAEAMIVERDLWLVRDTGCRYHVSHISSKELSEAISLKQSSIFNKSFYNSSLLKLSNIQLKNLYNSKK